ncbi:glycosyltransferase family 4 protein [Dermacoccus abyssi]|uniref:Glycosyltransferase family 4 protein n=1 Tax=Dermacoccus abyssi TaxID=322596 RepID=A0ABX5ZBY3_9MICO|nr:glycosyltransferase family 4 protein [Dermacoccus abyssi]
MRIALSSYRSKPHSGGQGIYVRNLSRELVALGHEVTVFSGQPYPELDEGVRLEKVPSLDLYNDENPFRRPARSEFRDALDVAEFAGMLSGTFPEPRTFGRRLRRLLTPRVREFDVLHDNQTLAPGILAVERAGLPVVTTIHHPISADRRLEIADARTPWRKYTKWRWYSFVPMQARVARASSRIITVSDGSRDDIVREFGVDPQRLHVVPVGVAVEVFTPRPEQKVAGRLTTITSANVPLKGLDVLLDAVAQLPAEAWSELVVVGTANGAARRRLARHGIEEKVRFVSGISDEELAELIASAEVHVVPSLYEGFSLPAVEAMACGTPLVATRVGALPQLIEGTAEDNAPAGILVEPNDAAGLADGIRSLLESPDTRTAFGHAGRSRAESTYSWRAVARATVRVYEQEIARADR